MEWLPLQSDLDQQELTVSAVRKPMGWHQCKRSCGFVCNLSSCVCLARTVPAIPCMPSLQDPHTLPRFGTTTCRQFIRSRASWSGSTWTCRACTVTAQGCVLAAMLCTLWPCCLNCARSLMAPVAAITRAVSSLRGI